MNDIENEKGSNKRSYEGKESWSRLHLK